MKQGSITRFKRTAALFLSVMMTFVCASCGDSKTDDNSMTRSLLDSYMSSFLNYDINGLNKCCMARLDGYDDSEEATKGCKILTSRIVWECETISIDGNSAIAQVKITRPADFEGICTAALDEAIDNLDKNPEADPGASLTSALKKQSSGAETTEESVEISMTKVDNKWYIVKSLAMNRIISDIRTPVRSVYLLLGY
jgi:hypothetical protein